MCNFSRLFRNVFVLLALTVTACQAKDTTGQEVNALPPSMLGTWQVTKVHIDTGKSRWNTRRDDKFNIYQFLGRVFTITPEQLLVNTPFDEPCVGPELLIKKSTADKIIAKSISTRFQMGTIPTAKEMQLPLAGNAPVEVLYLLCQGKPLPKYRGNAVDAELTKAIWFINLGNNKLLISWHKETILLLEPLAKNTKPVASYSCARAGTVVEKTICGSAGLAAYDRSVAARYKYILSYYRSKSNAKSNLVELKKGQRAWLKERDACGSDIKCLEKSMAGRISDMDYDFSDYTYRNRRM